MRPGLVLEYSVDQSDIDPGAVAFMVLSGVNLLLALVGGIAIPGAASLPTAWADAVVTTPVARASAIAVEQIFGSIFMVRFPCERSRALTLDRCVERCTLSAIHSGGRTNVATTSRVTMARVPTFATAHHRPASDSLVG